MSTARIHRHRRWVLLAAVVVPAGVLALITLPGRVPAAGREAPGKEAAGAATRPAEPPAAAPGQAEGPASLTIQLDGVPNELSLPAAAKHNHMLTAHIRGGVPKDVWVARSADSPHAVAVPAFGEGRYQVNLADDRVVLALRRTGNSGQCFLFARDAAGKVAQSAAIRFDLRGPTASFSLRQQDGTSESVSGTPQGWAVPGRVKGLSLFVDPSLPGLQASALAGGRSWQLKSEGEKEEKERFSLDVTPEIAAAWEEAGAVQVHFSPPLHQPNTITLRAIPSKLRLPPEGLTLHATARAATVVPGSNQYLSFTVGNVTREGADVTLRRADENRPDGDPPIGVAQVFRLPSGAQYVWVITETSPLPQEDRAVTLAVLEGAKAEEKILHTLFRTVRSWGSSTVMTFNGNKYGPEGAAAQLEELYKRSGATDLASFLEAVRAREKEKNSTVVIDVRGVGETPAAEWVVRAVREMGWLSEAK